MRIRMIACGLLMGCCLSAAQQVINRTSLRHQARISLADAFKSLEEKTGCTFIFTYDDVAPYSIDSAFVVDTSKVELERLLEGLPFQYTFRNGCYVIRKANVSSLSDKLPVISERNVRQKEISGKVLNRQNEPVEAALVWMIDATTNQSVAQTITDMSGHFTLPLVNKEVKLTVTCLGYSSYMSETFEASEPHVFPAIVMDDKALALDNVVVVGEKMRPLIEQKAGKLIFNVENSINAQGSNAYEILRQTPGVLINEETKSISINGRSGILVMLNGKQTYMQQSEVMDLLKSTSSSHIKSIEVMSNASSQYDAAGSGGILNIVMKRERADGLFITANMGVSYWFNLKQNTEFSFNYNRDKLNLYGSYGHNLGHSALFYGSDRKQSEKLFESRSEDVDKRNTATMVLGVDYLLSKEHTIGFQGNGNFLFGPGDIVTHTKVYEGERAFSSQLLYSMRSLSDYVHQLSQRYNFNIDYRFERPDEHLFTLDIDYGWFKGDSEIDQPNSYSTADGQEQPSENYHSTGLRKISLYAVSGHYQRTLSLGELQAGMKYASVSSRNGYRLFEEQQSAWVMDRELSNDFRYRESILAAYVMADLHLSDHWLGHAGLRMEYTHSNGHLFPVAGSSQMENRVKSDYIDLFPFVGVSWLPAEKHSVTLSYGKRIDRPVYADLNPIDQPLDGLSSWRGNPFLSPQNTHRVSLQYQYDKTSLELSYSRTNDYRVQVTDTLGADKIVMTPRNLGKQNYFGVSLSQALRLWHALDLNLSGQAYYLDNHMAFSPHRFYRRKRWAGGLSLQSSFPLFWGIRSELLAVYSTRRLGGSTELLEPNFVMDIGFQKKFWGDKGVIKLSCSDLFWSNNWDNMNSFDNFESKSYGYGESRMVKLNFTYKFGGTGNKRTKQLHVESELNRF